MDRPTGDLLTLPSLMSLARAWSRIRAASVMAFAGESIRFIDFHVAPICSPTRGHLLTGLSALRNGATLVTAGRTFLRPGLPTIPELFAAAGYATPMSGSRPPRSG